MARPIGDYNTSKIVKLIESARREAEIDVITLCHMAGITTQTYYHWIEGIRSPNLATLEMVAEKLGKEITLREIKRG